MGVFVLFIDLYVINESRDFREEYRVALMVDKIISLKEANKNRTIINLLGDESYEVKGSVAAIKNKIKKSAGGNF